MAEPLANGYSATKYSSILTMCPSRSIGTTTWGADLRACRATAWHHTGLRERVGLNSHEAQKPSEPRSRCHLACTQLATACGDGDHSPRGLAHVGPKCPAQLRDDLPNPETTNQRNSGSNSYRAINRARRANGKSRLPAMSSAGPHSLRPQSLTTRQAGPCRLELEPPLR